ncbi:MAG: tRNA pseudouridine(55) synthase TruB [Synergistes sp.]|nr:tRNA pseudouridine(55) synthase TruB [Synergistes sp.]
MSVPGILPINKPEGARSTDCVSSIRRILGRKVKTGHGGTLDSTASGVLVILAGQATRLSNFIMELPKVYETEVTFGSATSTDDASGEIIECLPWDHLTDAALDSALCAFFGWRMQSPPAVSAVHIDGQRAHVLARSGQAALPEARPVCFLDISRLSGIDEKGKVLLRVACRKGTYIRSFARDLGRYLGTAAHVSRLTRVSSGPFRIERAMCAERAFSMSKEELSDAVIPASSLCDIFPCYEADGKSFERLSHGQRISLEGLRRRLPLLPHPLRGRVIVASEKIFSICSAHRKGGSWELAPEVNIMAEGEGEQ